MVLPRCPSTEELALSRKRWIDASLPLMSLAKDEVDDAEIFIRHYSSKGWFFAEQQLSPYNSPIQGECYLRIFWGGAFCMG